MSEAQHSPRPRRPVPSARMDGTDVPSRGEGTRMATRSDQGSSSSSTAAGALLLGVVMTVLGIWLLSGDVVLGSLVIGQSSVFGGIALAAGVLGLIGGALMILRSRRA